MSRRRTQPLASPSAFRGLDDDQLLNLRLCDLKLSIEGSDVEPLLRQTYAELRRRKITFQPHAWISYEWFTPDGVGGFALPFYLVDDRLRQLERRQMQGIEGETKQRCLRILRHEMGHAIENAYALRKLECVQKTFGRSDIPYPTKYLPKPYSRKFVRNVGEGYAQSHPDEDFAETFAVWLTPKAQWKKRYATWPALHKLLVMDQIMKEHVAGRRPKLKNKRRVEPLPRLKTTLRRHYQQQRRRFGLSGSPSFDQSLRKLFREEHAPRVGMTASAFLRTIKKKMVIEVAQESGEAQHNVDRVVEDMILRSKALNLHVAYHRGPSNRAYRALSPLLKAHVGRFMRLGRHRIAI